MHLLQRAPTLTLAALALTTAAITAALLLLTDLPAWVAVAFLAALPFHYLALHLTARALRRAFLQDAARRIDSGADRFQPPHPDLASPLLRFWVTPLRLHLDLIDLYAARQRQPQVLLHTRAALDLAPDHERPRLAARAAEALPAKAPPHERIDLLTLAAQAPDAAPRHLEALALLLLEHRRDHAQAQALLERALRAEHHRPDRRFKRLALLALTAAAAGRFGAADGYLDEAEAEMPSGDPGFVAFLARNRRRVAQVKAAQADAFVLLKQLIEAPEGPSNATPLHLPEPPEEP